MVNTVVVSKTKMVASGLLLCIWIPSMVTLFLIGSALRIPGTRSLIPVFHRGVLWVFDLKCRTEGTANLGRPVMYVSNHVSYLDIFVLGSILPASFIAKAEIASWPLFGTLAKLQKSLFIDRNSREVGSQVEQIRGHLHNDSNLVLFPEGTSSLGTRIRRFYSGLFQAAEDGENGIDIQPLTVAYTRYKGERMDRATRDRFAWYRPMKMGPHFLNNLGMGRGEVVVIFHPTVTMDSFESRKECAQHCESVIRSGLLQALDLTEEAID